MTPASLPSITSAQALLTIPCRDGKAPVASVTCPGSEFVSA
jgi:hypothetical protein